MNAKVIPIRWTGIYTVGDYEVHAHSLKWYVKNTKTGQEYPEVGDKGLAIEVAKALDEYDRISR